MQKTEKTALGIRMDLAENPMPNYRALKDEGSIIPNDGLVPTPSEWVATSWETVSFVLRNAEMFSSADTGQAGRMGSARPLIPLEIDPPEHHRYRKILDPFFSPNVLRPLEPVLRAQINEYIDAFIDRGSADLLAEFFVPYPTAVFLTLYGLPLEDRPTFLRWKDEMIRGSITDPDLGARTAAEFYGYMTPLIEGRDGTGDDLLSKMVKAGLTVEEILDITYLFIMAGLDTVTTALSATFAYLATHPEQRRLIVENPSIVSTAVEELLRVETPAPALSRRATADIEVGGVMVKEGEEVFCHLGAANSDLEGCPNAVDVDLTRTDNRHATFGLGVHRCLGSHLARIEVRLVVDEFHRRIPNYALAPDTDLFRVPFFEGFETLPIVFPAGGR